MALVAAVLVPVKAFDRAKVRLAPALPAPERAALARLMAEGVLRAAGDLRRAVVCDDAEVADWARLQGAEVVWAPGRGLNGAVQHGVEHLAAQGVDHVIVAHSDLPLADDLTWVARFAGVTIVPDRHDKGSNVVGVPTDVAFRFAYGNGSFARHCAEARRLHLALRIARRPPLTWDVDVPADLDYSRSTS